MAGPAIAPIKRACLVTYRSASSVACELPNVSLGACFACGNLAQSKPRDPRGEGGRGWGIPEARRSRLLRHPQTRPRCRMLLARRSSGAAALRRPTPVTHLPAVAKVARSARQWQAVQGSPAQQRPAKGKASHGKRGQGTRQSRERLRGPSTRIEAREKEEVGSDGVGEVVPARKGFPLGFDQLLEDGDLLEHVHLVLDHDLQRTAPHRIARKDATERTWSSAQRNSQRHNVTTSHCGRWATHNVTLSSSSQRNTHCQAICTCLRLAQRRCLELVHTQHPHRLVRPDP